MNSELAVNLLSTLGSEHRLNIFRMLLQAGKSGLNPKNIAEELDIKPNKLSFHLNSLKKFNLISCEKNGREIVYFANYNTTQELVDFLFQNCCNDDNSSCSDINICS